MNWKNIFPKKIRNLRHLFYAFFGAVKYKHPSRELLVIGVTGTSGKSSTIYFLRQLLESAGFVVGSLSTIDFYVAGENKLNDQKMTMLGKMQIQKYLREMVEKKCDVAILETTSEGAVQYRHRFIDYDMMILTNLYPEHIESHGGFANYKAAKLSIFQYVAKLRRKKEKQIQSPKIQNIFQESIPKVALVNGDSEFSAEFLQFSFDEKMTFASSLSGTSVQQDGLHFVFNSTSFQAPIFGEHNVSNLLSALQVATRLEVPVANLQQAVAHIKGPEGRVEFIREAESHGFQVIVDYAFEPVAMQKLYDVVRLLAPKQVIHVFGSTGGGRDKARRFTVGALVGQRANVCVITNEDPYDDNPEEIIDNVASAVRKTGKEEGKNLFKISDRREAIYKALALAGPGDLVLVTGKGSEQGMVVKGEIIPWDDRSVVRDGLREMKKT